MKIGLKNIIIVLILFVGAGSHFFLKSFSNTQGLIINHIFVLNVNQANTFYFIMGCLCILILILCGVGVYIQNKQNRN
jgi:hypothetical protein